MGTGEYRVYNAQALAAAIRHFREQEGLTQAELAERSGVHRTYLSDLERGRVTEQVERLVQILEALGTRITVSKAEW